MVKPAIFLLGFFMIATSARTNSEEPPLAIGLIGLDTSHVIAFTQLLNDTHHPSHVPGGRVVAAFKGGSPDLEASYSRVEGYTKQLVEDYNVKIVPTIEQLCQMVDAIMLTSVDGRPHLEQVKPVFAAGKRVYIDKPLAGSFEDAKTIVDLGKAYGVPWFSSSSYRFYESLQQLKKRPVGDIRGAISYGPCHLEPTHPDLFWYGIHPVEALFTILGTGCQKVTCLSTEEFHVATGIWQGGRVGTFYGLRTGATPHKVIVFGSKDVAAQEGSGDYAPLVAEIVKFFRTGIPPVSPEETLELFAFMEAAHESLRRGGASVLISEIWQQAEP